MFVITSHFFFYFRMISGLQAFLVVTMPTRVSPIRVREGGKYGRQEFIIPCFRHFFTSTVIRPYVLHTARRVRRDFCLVFDAFFSSLQCGYLGIFHVVRSSAPWYRMGLNYIFTLRDLTNILLVVRRVPSRFCVFVNSAIATILFTSAYASYCTTFRKDGTLGSIIMSGKG